MDLVRDDDELHWVRDQLDWLVEVRRTDRLTPQQLAEFQRLAEHEEALLRRRRLTSA